MSSVIAAALFLLAGVLVATGVIRLLVWRRERVLRRLDAEYRAYALVASAKRDARRISELERSVAALETTWGVRK
ncbi:hypothetical protein [uncultured Xanthomonas sp.]|uniref:hypothetical protein n=1 Tax=uncultured Xanthomonas sp. TaxID=152831 RepID=UPI0025F41C6C|nr:hypothetical protein [uncultured Xanthomonas sp.]